MGDVDVGTGRWEHQDREMGTMGPGDANNGTGRWEYQDREMGISGPWVAEAGGVGCGSGEEKRERVEP